MTGLFDALVEKKRFRLSVFKLFEGIISDVSITKREKEKLEKLDKEEKIRDSTNEEDDDIAETKNKSSRTKVDGKFEP